MDSVATVYHVFHSRVFSRLSSTNVQVRVQPTVQRIRVSLLNQRYCTGFKKEIPRKKIISAAALLIIYLTVASSVNHGRILVPTIRQL